MKIKKIYFDLDGVLANFKYMFSERNDYTAPAESFYREIYSEEIRSAITRYGHFYDTLSVTKDAGDLFAKAFDEYGDKCEILSVIPDLGFGTLPAMEDKAKWVRKNISADVIVNVIFREELPLYCTGRGAVLISHLEENVRFWEDNGGTGIEYTKPKGLIRRLKMLEGSDRSPEAVNREKEKLSAKVAELIEKQKAEISKLKKGYEIGIVRESDITGAERTSANNVVCELAEFCDAEEIEIKDHDDIYRAVYQAFGIRVEKVPVRYYPKIIPKTGSLYIFKGVICAEDLYYDEDPIGKTFEFKLEEKIGQEDTYISYFFKVQRESQDPGADRYSRFGWKQYEGNGKPEGYEWAGASITVREQNGEIQSVAYQKMYLNPHDPIWKKASPYPADKYTWIGCNEPVPDDFELPESGYYYDETLDPPRGLHYKEQGLLAFDEKADEIIILGITDYRAERVEIPREINGKPVTVLDRECFMNCHRTLQEVILPDTIRKIGDRAFRLCTELKKPDLPASAEIIGEDIFSDTDIQ